MAPSRFIGPATPHRRSVRAIALMLALSLVAAACGGDGNDDGAQKFEDVSGAIEGDAEVSSREESDVAESSDAMEESVVEEPLTTAVPSDDVQQQPALRAGSVDDNDDFSAYLAYRDQFLQSGLPVRALDVAERHRVQVVDADQRAVANALVTVYADDEPQAQIRAGNDGIVLIHPGAYSRIEPQDVLTIQVDDSDQLTLDRSDPGSDTLVLSTTPSRPQTVDLDIVFLLDATGSMGDEIDQLRSTIDDVAQRLDGLPSQPRVRLGLTHYRDEGEDYLSQTFDLTADIDSFRNALSEVRADGGGDYPEALDEGLADALTVPTWRDAETTTQLIFVVADAPPQVERSVEQPYDNSLRDAAARGVKIFPIASSGSEDDAEYVFRQLAQFTGSRFVFLSYGAGGSAALGSESDISAADYDELPLNDLIVRLVSEELEALER